MLLHITNEGVQLKQIILLDRKFKLLQRSKNQVNSRAFSATTEGLKITVGK